MEIVNYTLEQQTELLSRQESHFMDFKRGDISPGKMQETIVAFANADGGELFVGIANDVTLSPPVRIFGFATQEAANNHVSCPEKLVNPPLLGVTMEFLRLPGKTTDLVLHLIVPKSEKVHYTASGECFKRKGAQNLRIREKDIENLIFTKGQLSYEDTFVDGMFARDLKNSSYLAQYASLVRTAQPATIFLRKQRLIESLPGVPLAKTRIKTAAVLLFDDEPQAVLPTRAGVKISRYRTTARQYDRSTLEGTPQSVDGPVELLIRRSVAKIEEIVKSSYIRVGGEYEQAGYPIAAIHEIVANAVLHRDYSLKDDIHVGIYDNRIEVTSPGRLPGYITPANILDERFMRNPKIVRLVNKLPNPPNKDIGEGLNTAFKEMHKARLRDPVIEELEAAVKVTLLHDQIASRAQQVVHYLREHDTITNRKAREITGKESANAIYKVFVSLIARGVIEIVDPTVNISNTEYKLTSNWQTNWLQKKRRKRKKR